MVCVARSTLGKIREEFTRENHFHVVCRRGISRRLSSEETIGFTPTCVTGTVINVPSGEYHYFPGILSSHANFTVRHVNMNPSSRCYNLTDVQYKIGCLF